MSVNNLFSNNGVLWSIRANDISGNYGQKIDLSTVNAVHFLTGGTSRAMFNNSGLVLQSAGNTITTQQSSNLILDASNSFISLRTSGVERLALNGVNIDIPNSPSVNDVSIHLNTILKVYDSNLATRTNAIGLYSTGSAQYFLRHFGSSTTSILNLGISSTNANEMIDLISILPRSTLRLYSPTIDISGNANFRNIPTCSVVPTSSNQLINKAYSDLRPALSLTAPYGDTTTLLSVPNSADWYKFTFNSPSVIVTQNSANSFTGLYNTTTGVITIPTGYTGFWQVSFNSSLGTSQSFTAAAAVFGNNNALGYNDNNGVISPVWLNGTSYSRQAFSGIGYLTAGTSYVIWYNMASSSFPVAFKSEFVNTSLRLVFLGY